MVCAEPSGDPNSPLYVILSEEFPSDTVISGVLSAVFGGVPVKVKTPMHPAGCVTGKKQSLAHWRFAGVYCGGFEVYGHENTYVHVLALIVKGSSSFVDFLVYLPSTIPEESYTQILKLLNMSCYPRDDILRILRGVSPEFAVEFTKTSGDESRNTAVFQRASKFIWVQRWYPSAKRIMLYGGQPNTTSAQTVPFGLRLLRTIGVDIYYLSNMCGISCAVHMNVLPYSSVSDLITAKRQLANRGRRHNIPLLVNHVAPGVYEIRAKVTKNVNGVPRIAHDPNIGATTLLAAALCELDPNINEIIIYDPTLNASIFQGLHCNKWVEILEFIREKYDLKDIRVLGANRSVLGSISAVFRRWCAQSHHQKGGGYWLPADNVEKHVTILLEMLSRQLGGRTIFSNHGSSERGYLELPNGHLISISKQQNVPDIVIVYKNAIYVVEGKQECNIVQGLSALNNYAQRSGFVDKFLKNNGWAYPVYYVVATMHSSSGVSLLSDVRHQFALTSDGYIYLRPSHRGRYPLFSDIYSGIFTKDSFCVRSPTTPRS